jgi:hypothetical protein
MGTCTKFTVYQVPFEYFEVGKTSSTYGGGQVNTGLVGRPEERDHMET